MTNVNYDDLVATVPKHLKTSELHAETGAQSIKTW
jgi:hypothetical protein